MYQSRVLPSAKITPEAEDHPFPSPSCPVNLVYSSIRPLLSQRRWTMTVQSHQTSFIVRRDLRGPAAMTVFYRGFCGATAKHSHFPQPGLQETFPHTNLASLVSCRLAATRVGASSHASFPACPRRGSLIRHGVQTGQWVFSIHHPPLERDGKTLSCIPTPHSLGLHGGARPERLGRFLDLHFISLLPV